MNIIIKTFINRSFMLMTMTDNTCLVKDNNIVINHLYYVLVIR